MSTCKRAIGPLIQDEASKVNPAPLPGLDDPRWDGVKTDSTKLLDLLQRAPDLLTLESPLSAMYLYLPFELSFSLLSKNYSLNA